MRLGDMLLPLPSPFSLGRAALPQRRRGEAPFSGEEDIISLANPRAAGYRWAPFGMVKEIPDVDTPPKYAPYEAAEEPDAPPPAPPAPEAKPAPPRQPQEVLAPAKVKPASRRELEKARRESFKALRRVFWDAYHEDGEEQEPLEADARRGQAQQQPRRRLGRSVYDAMETHGHFGLVDGGETLAGGVRVVVAHVPKRNRGYALDIKPGEVIYANSARGTQARGRLDVLFVSRHKYVSPGHAVTSCRIGVSEGQWRRFVE